MTSDPAKPLCVFQFKLDGKTCGKPEKHWNHGEAQGYGTRHPYTPPAETGRCENMVTAATARFWTKPAEPAAPVSPPEDIEYHSKVANATLGRIYAKEYKKVGEVAPVSPEPPRKEVLPNCLHGIPFIYSCPKCRKEFGSGNKRMVAKLRRDTGPVGATPEPKITRFAEFDDADHPFRKWWEEHGQFMLSGGGRRESIWAARGWIAREQLLCGKEVTGDSMHEAAQSLSSPTQAQESAESLAKTWDEEFGDHTHCDVCGTDCRSLYILHAGSPVQPVGSKEQK